MAEEQAASATLEKVEAGDYEEILQRKTKTFRVNFGKSWVDCKKKLTVGDRSAINQSTVNGKIISRSGDEVELGSLALGNSVIQTLVQAIVNWGGPAFCTTDHSEDPVKEGHRCQPIALTPQNIAIMNDGPAQVLSREITNRNPVAKAGSKDPTNGSEPKS